MAASWVNKTDESMKKMTTLCLALALTCATEAGATTDKQPKLKGRQTAA